jgi:hypothetical protein
MSIDWDEYLRDLRVTTTEVTAPLITLAARRLEMLREAVKFIEAQPETVRKRDFLEMYNAFVANDQQLVQITRGKADDCFDRPR